MAKLKIRDADLLPCPFCGSAMMLRDALWPSEGDTDGILHAAPTDCPLPEFSVSTADECMSVAAAWNKRTPAQEWQDISTAPNDSDFRWYGLHVQHKSGHSWFEAHYVSHDDDAHMIEPSGDYFTDWAFSDFEVWCDAPPPPVAVIAEERTK